MIVVAAVGLALGLGGGTTWSALRERDALLAAKQDQERRPAAARPEPKAIEQHKDTSTAAAPALVPAPDSLVAGPASDTLPKEPAGTDTASAPEAGAGAQPAAPGMAAPAMAAPGVPVGEGAKRLAKIFAAMKPADAAGVLSLMSDAEAAAVLVQMSERQAAPVLGSLPPERAATLGRVVLAGRGSGE